MQRPIESECGNGGKRVVLGLCRFDMKVKGAVSLVLIGVKVVGWVAGLACCLEHAS